MCGQARAEAERRTDPDTDEPLPHNAARRAFFNAVVRQLARQQARDLGGRRTLAPEDEEGLRADLAAAPAVRGVLDVLWPDLEPQQLLARLYQDPSRLDLSEDERAAITRETPGPWTLADVPLLDELAELARPSTPRSRRPAASAPPTRPSTPRRSSTRRS